MFDLLRERTYNPVPDADIEDSNSSSDGLLSERHQPKRSKYSRVNPVAQAALLIMAIAIAIGLGFWLGRHEARNLNDVCIRHTSKYSPMLKDIDITYSEWQFDGSFVHENIYRQDPSPEVDEAWEALGISNRVLILPKEEGPKAGLSPVDHVQVSDKYGGGYPVMVEGLHQLHCLNLVRKSLFYSYDYYFAEKKNEFVNDGEPLRWHISHCLDFLRQRLMCDVDIGVFGAVWYNTSDPTPFVDFNTKHVCRNFEDVRTWATEHQSAKDLPYDYWAEPTPEMKIRPSIP